MVRESAGFLTFRLTNPGLDAISCQHYPNCLSRSRQGRENSSRLGHHWWKARFIQCMARVVTSLNASHQ